MRAHAQDPWCPGACYWRALTPATRIRSERQCGGGDSRLRTTSTIFAFLPACDWKALPTTCRMR